MPRRFRGDFNADTLKFLHREEASFKFYWYVCVSICGTNSALRGVGNSRSWSFLLTVQARHPVRFARWRGFSSSK